MTWKELAQQIAQMSDEQQRTDVTIVDAEVIEGFAVNYLTDKASWSIGLDDNHPYLVFRDEDKSFFKQLVKEDE